MVCGCCHVLRNDFIWFIKHAVDNILHDTTVFCFPVKDHFEYAADLLLAYDQVLKALEN